MSTVSVFSELPYPISGKARNAKGQVVGTYLILTGPNDIPEEIWACLLKDSRIQKRLDERRLLPDYTPLQRDFDKLRDPAERTYIKELCARTSSIRDNELFGQTGQNAQQQLNQLEAEIKRLKQGMA